MTDPREPLIIQYVNNRNFAGNTAAGTAGDRGPEGIPFIPGAESPTGGPLPVVANEVSGTTTIYRIDVKPGERDGDERRRRGGDPD